MKREVVLCDVCAELRHEVTSFAHGRCSLCERDLCEAHAVAYPAGLLQIPVCGKCNDALHRLHKNVVVDALTPIVEKAKQEIVDSLKRILTAEALK